MQDLLSTSLRPMIKNDRNFILSSWFQNTISNMPYEYDLSVNLHNTHLDKLIERSSITIACSIEDHSQIFGWLCSDIFNKKPVIHYCYVKALYRKCGIAKKLFDHLIKDDVQFYYTTKGSKKLSLELTEQGGIYCPLLKHGEFYGTTKETRQ